MTVSSQNVELFLYFQMLRGVPVNFLVKQALMVILVY